MGVVLPFVLAVIWRTFIFANIGPKKVSAMHSAEKWMMCVELKKEIVGKNDQGVFVCVCVVDLAKQYERSTPLFCTTLKQKELIRANIFP